MHKGASVLKQSSKVKPANDKKKQRILPKNTHYSWESDESDCELPPNAKHVRADLKDSEYMKLYQ
jgi:hypothetical protein